MKMFVILNGAGCMKEHTSLRLLSLWGRECVSNSRTRDMQKPPNLPGVSESLYLSTSFMLLVKLDPGEEL